MTNSDLMAMLRSQAQAETFSGAVPIAGFSI